MLIYYSRLAMVNSEFLQGIQGVRLVLYVVSSILMVRSCMSSISPHIFRLHNPVFSNSLIVLLCSRMLQYFDTLISTYSIYSRSPTCFLFFPMSFLGFPSVSPGTKVVRANSLTWTTRSKSRHPPTATRASLGRFMTLVGTCGEKKPAKLDGSTIEHKDLACVSHEEMQISLDLSLRNWDFTS